MLHRYRAEIHAYNKASLCTQLEDVTAVLKDNICVYMRLADSDEEIKVQQQGGNVMLRYSYSLVTQSKEY